MSCVLSYVMCHPHVIMCHVSTMCQCAICQPCPDMSCVNHVSCWQCVVMCLVSSYVMMCHLSPLCHDVSHVTQMSCVTCHPNVMFHMSPICHVVSSVTHMSWCVTYHPCVMLYHLSTMSHAGSHIAMCHTLSVSPMCNDSSCVTHVSCCVTVCPQWPVSCWSWAWTWSRTGWAWWGRTWGRISSGGSWWVSSRRHMTTRSSRPSPRWSRTGSRSRWLFSCLLQMGARFNEVLETS